MPHPAVREGVATFEEGLGMKPIRYSHRRVRMAVLLFLSALLTCPSFAADIAGYRLGAGDRVRVTVFGEPEMTGEFSVDGSGRLAMPLIGYVGASGQTAAQLERRLRDKLHPDYLRNPSVTVAVVAYRPFYIVGEVNKPGSYPYVSRMTVLNAVALAGGFTRRARQGSFYIKRSETAPTRRLDAAPDSVVLPGDVVTVRRRLF